MGEVEEELHFNSKFSALTDRRDLFCRVRFAAVGVSRAGLYDLC